MLKLYSAVILTVFGLSAAGAGDNYRGHALAMFGDIKYGPDFTHFDYVNPQAPKGGTAREAVTRSTFDNLNSFILKGQSAKGLGLLYNTLMQSSADEPFTMYGELAEDIEVPADRSWVIFTLRKEARWHDGRPVTVEDVVFTLETMKTKGHPFYRSYWGNVEKAEKVGERRVKFSFGGDTNHELPLIIGQMQVIPKHYWEGRDFEVTTLEPPLGSGPYKIESVDPGRAIVYRRVEDYWGADIPVEKGKNNFDVLHYDYYRDDNVAIEALKSGAFDFRPEYSSKEWATAYDVPAVKEGRLVRTLIDNENGNGMQGFWFNLRREKFADKRVREALGYAFDFEWTNENLFYGQYTRTVSYFSNSELASDGLPQGQELEILEPYRDRLPKQVFAKEYQVPVSDGSGNIRKQLRAAIKLLGEAGWKINSDTKKLQHTASGAAMEIEILLVSPAFERIVNPYVANLEKLGVTAKLRVVDSAQYQNRLQDFDYDMIVGSIGQSQSPGNEQRDYWASDTADLKGSRNYAGIKDPVVDELIEKLISAPDRESLVAYTRALDRVLLWGHYVVPHWHTRSWRVLYWDKFGRPAVQAKHQLGFPAMWWYEADKAAALD
jgi:microcin C transport system substrate-binding protein